MDIKVGKLTLGSYQTNCYLVYREDTMDVLVVDPADNGSFIYEKLLEKGFNIQAVLLTHGHFDHVYGVRGLREKTNVKVYACEAEEALLKDPALNVSDRTGRPVMVNPDVLLRDNEETEIAGIKFKVIHTPGHTKGSCCYYFEEAGVLIAGDTLFCESVGRSDFPTGSERELLASINDKLMCLPDNVRVYPGHGGSTTIGSERENNPFVNQL